jgi:predicted RNA binding protein YcfA (HicA-like mRNA interferase family)
MSRKDKLIQRLLSRPKDFSWDDLLVLLSTFGFEEVSTGKTGGSRRRFANTDGVVITLHKPHPRNILKAYQVEQIIDVLTQEGFL